MIKVEIVKDSVSEDGIRLTTFVLTYPRFIHSEFMTHRVFSRNASSSRAIPVKKQIQMVKENPAMPLAFAANKAGMQAGEQFGPFKQWLCRFVWKSACYAAVFFATLMEKLNIHKQYANRILEPFNHITVVCTATDYENFFALRYHPDAQPEIHELAKKMYEMRERRIPKVLKPGEWHLPFVSVPEFEKLTLEDAIKCSVARCARTSYLNHNKEKPALEEDKKLHDRLVLHNPMHASPAEHQATPLDLRFKVETYRSGNFVGWMQYRKTLPNENIINFTKPEDRQS